MEKFGLPLKNSIEEGDEINLIFNGDLRRTKTN